MAYDGTIPALGNLISNDIPAMQENFSLLESAQIVDSGSTADGDYWRLEDGLQVCEIQNIVLSFNQSSNLSSTWTFPQNFIATPSVFWVPYVLSDTSEKRLFTPIVTTETNTNIAILRAFNEYLLPYVSGDTTEGNALAIGRWK